MSDLGSGECFNLTDEGQYFIDGGGWKSERDRALEAYYYAGLEDELPPTDIDLLHAGMLDWTDRRQHGISVPRACVGMVPDVFATGARHTNVTSAAAITPCGPFESS